MKKPRCTKCKYFHRTRAKTRIYDHGQGISKEYIEQIKTPEESLGVTSEEWNDIVRDSIFDEGIDIPFGAFDSELRYLEINIPDGFEATIEDRKIILKKRGTTMIKIIEERPVPRDTVICLNCHSTLEYGNADLTEDYCWGDGYLAYSVPKYYFRCPVCGCKVKVPWIRKEE